MTALTLFVFLALLLTLAESRPFNPILLNTQTTDATTPALYWDSKLPSTPVPDAVKNLLETDLTEEKYTSCEPARSVMYPFLTYRYKGDRPVYYKSKDEKISFSDEVLSNLLANVYFLEKDLHPGISKELYFPKSCNNVPFIPREVANSIPFSSDKLSEIYDKLSIKPESTIAEMMENTINVCEMSGVEGEKKQCATSLESMIDFSTSVLGNNVRAISTDVDAQTPLHNYTITTKIKKLKGDNPVVCHKLNYAYAVFFCHSFGSTKAYKVTTVGADGTMAKVAAMCHSDTSAWDPNDIPFKVLKVKRGIVPVCHFIPPGHILWTNN